MEKCPEGTVPIRRTSKEELSAAKTSFLQHFLSTSKDVDPPVGFLVSSIRIALPN